MPFIDFNHSPSLAATAVQADFTIVGAGAAGIFLAVKLAAQGRRILLLESGHFAPDDARQELNTVTQTGKPISNPIWNRKRILGGTTTAWGGQSLPFSALDFAPRPWVPDSGWPLEYADVARHYPAANAFMRVNSWNYDSDLFARLGRSDPGFDSSLLHYHFSKWAPQPDFLKSQRRALSAANITVLYNAQLTRIDRDATGSVSTIAVANFHGHSEALPVRHLILAAGGIETNRILLQNDHQTPGGLGNHSGWLGRAFMEHPAMTVGEVIPRRDFTLQSQFATHLHRLRKYSVRLSAAESWQRKESHLAASASLMFLPALNSTGRGRLSRRWTDLAQTVSILAARGFVYRPHSRAVLSIMVEQPPSRESYIALDPTVDRFGQRRARLHWHITEPTWRTAVEFTQVVKTEIERLGLGTVNLLPSIQPNNPDWAASFSDVNHHMGGTRMSATPHSGVVTPDLQVWHIPNLHVCSCSVFPTGSHSNPTLTLLALCQRLVSQLTGLPG